MHLDLTPEALLTQLDYPVNKQTLEQIGEIIKETKGLSHFMYHIPSFKEALAVEKGYIVMSNSVPRLKIKCDVDVSANNLAAFKALVEHWSEKYKLKLKAVNEATYYIIGQK